MRLPFVKTLSAVFENPKAARKVLEMTRDQLLETEAGVARNRECYHTPKTYDIRLHVLDALESGLYGVGSAESVNGEYAYYLNAGEMYAPTLIYWRGSYRVQSLDDFIETMQRRGVHFN